MSCIAGIRGRRAGAGMPAPLRVLMFAPVEHPDRKNSFEPFIYLTAEQPSHYDLVMDTEVLGVERAAVLIAAAAE